MTRINPLNNKMNETVCSRGVCVVRDDIGMDHSGERILALSPGGEVVKGFQKFR
jgi:hypothetical protein